MTSAWELDGVGPILASLAPVLFPFKVVYGPRCTNYVTWPSQKQ